MRVVDLPADPASLVDEPRLQKSNRRWTPINADFLVHETRVTATPQLFISLEAESEFIASFPAFGFSKT